MTTELHRMTAREAVGVLRSGDLAPLDFVDAAIQRIEAVDGAVNALPIRCFDRARDAALSFDMAAARDNPTSLCGLPIAVKDYNNLGGVRTTYGSPIFADHVPERSDATVRRLERNGAIPVAKSNVPEWAGGHTFNPVFGTTRNPWDTRLSAGGSSGGSSVALATGSVWLATGNDLGGSLRTPAAFNGIVGLRPGPGVVPRGVRLPAMDALWVEGPMGRSVGDVALMLDAGAGAEPDDPLSFDPVGSFVEALDAPVGKLRVAFSPDLGVVPMEPEIAHVCQAAVDRLDVDVTDDTPDFTGALDAFRTLRSVLFAVMMQPILEKHRDRIAPEIIGNIEAGLNIAPDKIFKAERARVDLFARVLKFFETHDFLICPTVSVPPFPVEQRYIEEIDGKPCETYIDWFAITFALTLTGCPTLSLPCGLTPSGLPVGIQIMGPPRGEAALLRAAHRFEAVLGMAERLPLEPRVTH